MQKARQRPAPPRGPHLPRVAHTRPSRPRPSHTASAPPHHLHHETARPAEHTCGRAVLASAPQALPRRCRSPWRCSAPRPAPAFCCFWFCRVPPRSPHGSAVHSRRHHPTSRLHLRHRTQSGRGNRHTRRAGSAAPLPPGINAGGGRCAPHPYHLSPPPPLSPPFPLNTCCPPPPAAHPLLTRSITASAPPPPRHRPVPPPPGCSAATATPPAPPCIRPKPAPCSSKRAGFHVDASPPPPASCLPLPAAAHPTCAAACAARLPPPTPTTSPPNPRLPHAPPTPRCDRGISRPRPAAPARAVSAEPRRRRLRPLTARRAQTPRRSR